ncbi:MAG: hypothetical protein Q4B94_03185 [Pseudomonadota bacterium]|nr:hypothetical protein [Pseudomonadota bacterium]
MSPLQTRLTALSAWLAALRSSLRLPLGIGLAIAAWALWLKAGLPGNIALVLSITLAFAGLYLDLRLGFDRRLLAISADTQQLDAALLWLGVLPAAKAGRNWEARRDGCLRLGRLLIFIVILQWLALLAAFALWRWS